MDMLNIRATRAYGASDDQPGCLEGFQARRVVRCQVIIDTRLRSGAELAPFEVVNISTAGFSGFSTMPLLIGSTVEIELAGTGFVPASIRWSLAGRIGVQFATPLTLDQCRRAILPDPDDPLPA